jgi:DNA-binding ferritin-like protein
MSAEIVTLMLTLRNQIKIYHWQTMKFPRHKSTDDLIDKLDDNIDKFVEVYMGKYGRPNFKGKASIKIHNFKDSEGPAYLRSAVDWLTKELPKYLKRTDTDLLNIRDEILGDLNQSLYLFTLN